MAGEESTLRILIATDNHLGYGEKDQVWTAHILVLRHRSCVQVRHCLSATQSFHARAAEPASATRPQIRQNDSFSTFEEILKIARGERDDCPKASDAPKDTVVAVRAMSRSTHSEPRHGVSVLRHSHRSDLSYCDGLGWESALCASLRASSAARNTALMDRLETCCRST